MTVQVLKQHRKAELRIDDKGRLSGDFEVSLKNIGDREVMTEFITEVRKQMREFDPGKKKKKAQKRRR